MSRTALVVMVVLLSGGGCGDQAAPPTTDEEVAIGFLRVVPSASDEGHQALIGELRSRGFVPGRNLTLYAGDVSEVYPDPEDAAAVVEGWVQEGVDLILAFSSTGAMAAAEATPGTPVLFISNNPTATGLLENEEQPEGQLTGVTFRVPADRTLDLARRALGRLDRLGLIYPANDPAAEPHRISVLEAARDLGMQVVARSFADNDDIERAMDAIASKGVDALFISNSPTAIAAVSAIQPFADAHGLPVIANSAFAEGAVITLEPDTLELNRQLGRQAARILAGAPVSDVPVEDPRRFLVIIDQGKATELGVELDQDVLREADQVRD